MKSVRNANIELLRILSMLMVLTMHCLSKTGALSLEGPVSLCWWFLEALCVPAVNVFVLITGYFSCQSKFRSRGILRVLGIVWSYAFLLSLLDAWILKLPLDRNAVLRMLIPILSKKYWFVNAWLALAVLSPALNLLIRSLSKKQFDFLLVFLLLLMVVRPSLLPREWGQDASMGLSVFFFAVLYLLAARIRLYGGSIRFGPGIFRLLYLVFAFSVFASRQILLKLGASEATAFHLYGYDSVPVVLQALCMLMIGLRRKPLPERASEIINALARNSFAVYVIHFPLNRILWGRLLHTARFTGRVIPGLIAVSVSVVLVYLGCILIEEGRLRLFRLLKTDRLTEPIRSRWDAVWE